jgi:hypothetical protein
MTTENTIKGIEAVTLYFNAPESKQDFMPFAENTGITFTIGVMELLSENGYNDNYSQRLIAYFTRKLKDYVKSKGDLDYLQKAKIFNQDIWIVDDGEVITWLLPDEY